MKITLQLELQCGNRGWPEFDFNSPIIEKKLVVVNNMQRHEYYTLNVADHLILTNRNKSDQDTVMVNGQTIKDQILRIKNIWIDDIKVDINLIKPYTNFIPQYQIGYFKYCKDNNIVVEKELVTYDIYFNGDWSFPIHSNFWIWYQKIREKQDIVGLSQNDVDKYIGVLDLESQKMLEQLKKLLNYNDRPS